MEKLKEEKISSQEKFSGRLLKLSVDTVKLPGGGKSIREVVKHPGAVAIIALTEDDELVLVRQWRHAVGEAILEIPAGTPNPGEDWKEAARRELEEETGYRAKKLQLIYEGFSSPGYSNELIRFYFARDMSLTKQNTEEDEKIEVDLVDLETCVDLVRTGKIKDNKSAVGILLADRFVKEEL